MDPVVLVWIFCVGLVNWVCGGGEMQGRDPFLSYQSSTMRIAFFLLSFEFLFSSSFSRVVFVFVLQLDQLGPRHTLRSLPTPHLPLPHTQGCEYCESPFLFSYGIPSLSPLTNISSHHHFSLFILDIYKFSLILFLYKRIIFMYLH